MPEVLGYSQATGTLQVEVFGSPKVRWAVGRRGLMVFLCVAMLFIITSFTGTVGRADDAASKPGEDLSGPASGLH